MEEKNEVIEEKDGKYLIKTTQGFAYIVIDDNLLQGSTISIKYLFTGTNISEIDRIASNLSDLRFKENKEVEKYAKTGAGANGYYDEYTYQVNSIDEKRKSIKPKNDNVVKNASSTHNANKFGTPENPDFVAIFHNVHIEFAYFS